MSWTLLVGVGLVLGFALLVSLSRRQELARMRRSLAARDTAERQGADEARVQLPVVDLSRCLGCATCVAVCPEDGVLDVVHGQAMVVNAARCKGISACERECPVGAITVTIADLAHRDDVPAVSDDLEAIGSPGLFLAGEVTVHALVRRAVEQGTAVAAAVAQRVAAEPPPEEGVIDLCIVGAGPAGIACALEATRLGLRFQVLEQETELGGTVARYPRRKLVLTEPIELPLHGRLGRRAYEKEELIDLWRTLADEHALPIRTGVTFESCEPDGDGGYVVRAGGETVRARTVCLAVGRRGTPRRLGVPGEDLPKVAYSLLDAASYQRRRVLVVGGGDSAVETALGLAEQDNAVVLSYRKEAFFRIGSRNEDRLRRAVDEGRVKLLLGSEVRRIGQDSVELAVGKNGSTRGVRLPNDDVFVMIGGVPPFAQLRESGVSFDATLREPAAEVEEQGSGLTAALAIGLTLTLGAGAFALWHSDYYGLTTAERPTHEKHALLRPGLGIGLALGIASVVLIAVNLLYLWRRSPRTRLTLGSLRTWMTAHVATGILAFLCALLHGAMAPRDTPGGHAFWAMAVLLVTGAIGRYFYAQVPRAANGRELELGEVRARLREQTDLWRADSGEFASRVREEIERLVERRQWRGTFVGRALALVGVQLDLRRTLRRLGALGREQGVDPARVADTLALAHRAHRAALMVAHFEDVRALLGAWRYLHRWVAVLMVVLVVVHVAYALMYGAHFFDRSVP